MLPRHGPEKDCFVYCGDHNCTCSKHPSRQPPLLIATPPSVTGDVLIPARGGSKSIHRKNLIPVAGKPLIRWSIEQARACPEVGQVYVSSDDHEILEEAQYCGAIPVLRPFDLAEDDTPTEAVIAHAIEELTLDTIVLLQPTSPARKPSDITACLNLLWMYDSGFSAYRCPDLCAWKQVGFEFFPVTYSPMGRLPRQQGPSLWVENGSIYVFTAEKFKQFGCRLHGKVGVHEMPKWSSIEIDELDDILIAEKAVEKISLA